MHLLTDSSVAACELLGTSFMNWFQEGYGCLVNASFFSFEGQGISTILV